MAETKSKNMPGARAKMRQNPAVRPKLIQTYFIFCRSRSGSSTIFFSVSSASRGMVNSAMTRIDETVRNLE